MKFLLVLAFAVVACAAVSVLPKREPETMDSLQYLMESEDDIELFPDDGVEINPQNIILRWQLNRFMRKIQKKMPCGFPEYDIPPLAPARLTDAHLEMNKGVVETVNDFHHLLLEGMDNFKFKRFDINIIFKRVKFDILFPNIKVSSPKFITKTLLDTLETMGISIQIEANDDFSFGLKNLRIVGVAHFDFPILWGSNKLKSLKTQVSIGKCNSHVGGVLGNGKLNNALNEFIEAFIEDRIAEMTDEISDMIENAVKPRVNKRLKGTDFWDIVEYILNAVDGEKEDDPIVVKCVPPPDPWT